jgi:hypothetical protein
MSCLNTWSVTSAAALTRLPLGLLPGNTVWLASLRTRPENACRVQATLEWELSKIGQCFRATYHNWNGAYVGYADLNVFTTSKHSGAH